MEPRWFHALLACNNGHSSVIHKKRGNRRHPFAGVPVPVPTSALWAMQLTAITASTFSSRTAERLGKAYFTPLRFSTLTNRRKFFIGVGLPPQVDSERYYDALSGAEIFSVGFMTHHTAASG